MNRKALFFTLLVIGSAIFPGIAKAQEVFEDKPQWKQYFNGRTSSGTILVYDNNKNNWMVYNIDRAKQSFSATSTFKILNALISLESGSVKDVDEDIIKWDGVKRGFGEWNIDMNLRTAMRLSATPVFHELAKRNGWETMKKYTKELNYGYVNLTDEHDDIWLEDNIKINCFEQLDFLRKLYGNELPFSRRTTEQVKDIITIETGDNYILRGKTGWNGNSDVGWLVGWLDVFDIEKGANIYFFALNMDIKNANYLKYRKQIVKDIFSNITAARFE